MSEKGIPCPCGELHFLHPGVHAIIETKGENQRIYGPDGWGFLVPRIYYAVHGITGWAMMEQLAERYGWERIESPGDGPPGAVVIMVGSS